MNCFCCSWYSNSFNLDFFDFSQNKTFVVTRLIPKLKLLKWSQNLMLVNVKGYPNAKEQLLIFGTSLDTDKSFVNLKK